jgi:hypothetical protein
MAEIDKVIARRHPQLGRRIRNANDKHWRAIDAGEDARLRLVGEEMRESPRVALRSALCTVKSDFLPPTVLKG